MFRFIHTADVHLDSPLRGLERYPGAPAERIRNASRLAFRNLVDLAIEEAVEFLLIAGDLYDGDWEDYSTGLFFAGELERLRRAGIGVFLVAGNHDASSRMSRSLELPDNARLFPAERAESVRVAEVGVVIHGRSFAQAAVTENLAASFPAAVPDLFNIGLLHTSVSGYEGHEPYAPCSLADLVGKGYDYWALGHVHTRDVLHRDPWVVFSGNIQGRHIREFGPKGCTLVTVDGSRVLTAEHREVDVLRWATCTVDATGVEHAADLQARFGDQLDRLQTAASARCLAIRVDVVGACAIHDQLVRSREHWGPQLRAWAIQRGGDAVWVEKVRLRTTPPDQRAEHDLDRRDGAIGELLRCFDELQEDEDRLAEVVGSLAPLTRRLAQLPPDQRSHDEDLSLDDPVRLRQALHEARQLLLSKLLSSEDSE